MRTSLFLFTALVASSLMGDDAMKTFNYDGKPLKLEVSRADMTHFVFDEEMAKPVMRKEQNLEFDVKGKEVWFRYMPKIKYQVVGDKKVEVERTIEAVREHFWLTTKTGKSLEIFVTPREGYGETIYIHDKEIEQKRAMAFETKDPRNQTIMKIAKAALQDDELQGYKLQEINELAAQEKNFNAYLKKRYVGEIYVIEKYEINVLTDSYIPDEYNFKKFPLENKVFISVYDWEKPLKKGDTTDVVIVGYKQ